MQYLYTKKRRQFNLLLKTIYALRQNHKWDNISKKRKSKLLSKLKRLYNTLTNVSNVSLAKLSFGALLICYGPNLKGQTFHSKLTNPFGLTGTGTFAIPTLVDIDSDGDLDLIVDSVNVSGMGKIEIHYYENIGNKTSPIYATGVINPFGINFQTASRAMRNAFVDLDNDGDLDLMRSEAYGEFHYFENTGSKSQAAFDTAHVNPFNLFSGKDNPMATFADLDGDGDYDMLTGSYQGDFYYFKNIGTKTNPVFAPLVKAPFGLLNTVAFITPEFIDFDKDGDMDIFSTDLSGNILYFKNTGTKTNPSFAPPLQNPFGLTANLLSPSFLTLGDVNGSGHADLLVGLSTGDFEYYENSSNINIIESHQDSEIKIFPNPATTSFVIDFKSTQKEVVITLTTIQGKVIYSNLFFNYNAVSIETTKFPKGNYLIQVLMNKRVVTKNLIIH